LITTLRPTSVLRAWWRDARSILAAIAGVPDYDRYLRHLRKCHPGATALSQNEFIHEQLGRRYSRQGSRCC
jgi:uncharacterized short protein YbdD (DUF466 family)